MGLPRHIPLEFWFLELRAIARAVYPETVDVAQLAGAALVGLDGLARLKDGGAGRGRGGYDGFSRGSLGGYPAKQDYGQEVKKSHDARSEELSRESLYVRAAPCPRLSRQESWLRCLGCKQSITTCLFGMMALRRTAGQHVPCDVSSEQTGVYSTTNLSAFQDREGLSVKGCQWAIKLKHGKGICEHPGKKRSEWKCNEVQSL